jgi:hypothetical protein
LPSLVIVSSISSASNSVPTAKQSYPWHNIAGLKTSSNDVPKKGFFMNAGIGDPVTLAGRSALTGTVHISKTVAAGVNTLAEPAL